GGENPLQGFNPRSRVGSDSTTLKSLYTKDSPSGFRESRFSRVKNNPFFSLFRRKPLILLRRESIIQKI
ncbi:MAG: hypothetical protein PVH64_12035, partial [Bacillota bacterium]